MSILQQLFASLHFEKVHVVNELHISLYLFNFFVPDNCTKQNVYINFPMRYHGFEVEGSTSTSMNIMNNTPVLLSF